MVLTQLLIKKSEFKIQNSKFEAGGAEISIKFELESLVGGPIAAEWVLSLGGFTAGVFNPARHKNCPLRNSQISGQK